MTDPVPVQPAHPAPGVPVAPEPDQLPHPLRAKDVQALIPKIID